MQIPVADQNQESHSSLVKFPYNNNDVPKSALQNNPVREQAGQLWAILSEDDTAAIYQQTAVKTWKLFKQIAILIFFLVVMSIALIFWVWGIGYQSGRQVRGWLEIKQPTLDDILYAMMEIIEWPFKWVFEWSNSLIIKYLGWEIQFDNLTPELLPVKAKGANPSPSPDPSASSSDRQITSTKTDQSSSPPI